MGSSDIRSGWLASCQYVDNFADIHPPLTPVQARIELMLRVLCGDADVNAGAGARPSPSR